MLARWVALVLLSGMALAQTPLFTFRGAPDSGFGEVLAPLGDVNSDGCPDFAISDVEDQHGDGAGRVRIHSGLTGVVLYEITGSKPRSRFGAAIASIGDTDLDGAADFVVASGSYLERSGRLQAFSGRTGLELWSCPGNVGVVALASAGDVDGDGRPDVLVGCRNGTSRRGLETGFVRVLSGTNGHELLRIDGTEVDSAFGFAVTSVGDLDHDDVPDFAVGAPGLPDHRDEDHPGCVHLFSGRTGSPIATLGASPAAIGLGVSFAYLPGADKELAIGAAPARLGAGAGAVLVFALDGATERTRLPAPLNDQWFGSSIAAVPDLDGDGRPELLIAAFARVYVFGSRERAPLHEFAPALTGARNRNFRVSSLGDLNHDGIPEIGITTRANVTVAGAYSGTAQILSTAPLALSADLHEVRFSKGGVQQLRLEAGKQHAGRSYTIVGTLSGTAPGFQQGAVQVPLNLDRYLVSTVQLADGNVFQRFRGQLDENGSATASIHLPPLGPQIKGLTAHHAFVVWQDGRQAFTSNAVPLSFVQ